VDQPLFARLLVVGLGLVGGSVALGAHKRGLAAEVRGVDPALDRAGPIPLVALEEGARWASAVVLAVPIEAMEGVLRQLAPHLSREAVLTDTCSVKGPVAALARELLPAPAQCVAAHPMAGGDGTGFAHARPDLFLGAPCILALAGPELPSVVDRVERFWQCLGTFTVRRTPEEHDAITAALSHAPHLIAFAYAQGLPEAATLALAGPGLRDFIRIARSNPSLWCEILLRNRECVAEEASRFLGNLKGMLDALTRGDREELERVLRAGQSRTEELER
jgi:prephenate dehydrogenase